MGVTVRSLRISEEFWASCCPLPGYSKSFGRHSAFSHDVGGGWSVTALMLFGEFWATARSLMMCEEFWASIMVPSLRIFEELWTSQRVLS